MLTPTKNPRGFTIVELLIVIVVIAILAAISVVAYNGVQERARTSKIKSDLAQLEKAIDAARVAIGDKPLKYVTGSVATANYSSLPDGTNLAGLDKGSNVCWTAYQSALNGITNASGIDVRQLVDPWGRPYFIDENEFQDGSTCGPKDVIGVYRNPFLTGWIANNTITISYVTPGC